MQRPVLPYQMPNSDAGKVDYLSKLMSLKPMAVAGIPHHKSSKLLTDVVLYHHLDRLEKQAVMKEIVVLPGAQRQALTEKVLAPMVSPYWGIWAMHTGELFRQYDFFDAVSTVGNHLGLSFTFAAGADTFRKLRFSGASAARGLLVTMAIWGFFWMNDQTKAIIQEEIFRRAGKPA